MKKYCLSIIILFLFMNVNLFSKPVKISKVSTDKKIKADIFVSTNTLIGDIFDYQIKIEHDQKVLLSNFNPITTLQNFEVKDYEIILPKRKNFLSKNIKRYYFYKVSSFVKGKNTIEGLSINYKYDNKNYTFKMPDIEVNVYGIFDEKDPKKNQLIDIKSLEKIYSKNKVIFFTVFLIILICILFYLFLLNRKKMVALSQKKLAPHEIAFQKLENLKNSDYLTNYDVKNFYIVLSEIFREYLENRYCIEILEKTTMEIFQELKNTGFDRNSAMQIKDVMYEMDLVKFAKYIPEKEIINSHFKYVYDFIEKTKEQSYEEEKLI